MTWIAGQEAHSKMNSTLKRLQTFANVRISVCKNVGYLLNFLVAISPSANKTTIRHERRGEERMGTQCRE